MIKFYGWKNVGLGILSVLVLFYTMGITVLYSQVHKIPVFLVSRLAACRFQPQKDEFDHFYAHLRPRHMVDFSSERVATHKLIICMRDYILPPRSR